MNIHRKTKIVATIGPASEKPEILRHLIEEGINAARLNFSHGDHAEHARRIRLIRRFEKETGRLVAIIGDLQGPKMRVGRLPEEGILLETGALVTFDTSKTKYERGLIPLPSPIFRAGTKKGAR
ncbi:MAG TPA: pyruvate kinase, partial [Candidatus Paceibacterota bacterium]|nr:pyruvate kinase [Candidatus Paceibacterota bacterium]